MLNILSDRAVNAVSWNNNYVPKRVHVCNRGWATAELRVPSVIRLLALESWPSELIFLETLLDKGSKLQRLYAFNLQGLGIGRENAPIVARGRRDLPKTKKPGLIRTVVL